MIIELSDEILLHKNYSEKDFRLDIAITLYQKGALNLSRAAQWAGYNIKVLQKELTQRNIPFETESPRLAPNDPLWEAIKPIKATANFDDLMKEQNYKGTDWDTLDRIAKEMDIQEPIEDLLAQLTP